MPPSNGTIMNNCNWLIALKNECGIRPNHIEFITPNAMPMAININSNDTSTFELVLIDDAIHFDFDELVLLILEHILQTSLLVELPPLQTYDVSIVNQSAVQPSPDTVLPSSHVSEPTLNPSPHFVTHAVGLAALF